MSVRRETFPMPIREQIRNSYLLVLRQNVTPRALRDELLAYVEAHGIPEK